MHHIQSTCKERVLVESLLGTDSGSESESWALSSLSTTSDLWCAGTLVAAVLCLLSCSGASSSITWSRPTKQKVIQSAQIHTKSIFFLYNNLVSECPEFILVIWSYTVQKHITDACFHVLLILFSHCQMYQHFSVIRQTKQRPKIHQSTVCSFSD